jgi:hypothetical protein
MIVSERNACDGRADVQAQASGFRLQAPGFRDGIILQTCECEGPSHCSCAYMTWIRLCMAHLFLVYDGPPKPDRDVCVSECVFIHVYRYVFKSQTQSDILQ